MNNNYLNGKVGVVTGSTSGLGLEIAKFMALNNSRVGINGKNSAKVKEISDSSKQFFPLAFDALSLKSINSAVERLKSEIGLIDYLICNIGGGAFPSEIPEVDRLKYMLDLNLHTAANVLSSFLGVLRPGLSSVVVISSIAAFGNTDAPHEYSLAKEALNTFASHRAKELARIGIRLNIISPGNLLFEGSVWDRRMKKDPDGTTEYISNRVPTGKFVSHEEIALCIAMMLDNRLINLVGANIVIDGGQSIL